MAWGYFFGILKAHYVDSSGHFIFDAATVGFYSGMIIKMPSLTERNKYKKIFPWFVLLFGWPIMMALIPLQHYLVQLVGLRGNVFWLPMLLVGAMMDSKSRDFFGYTLAILNMVAFGFAVAEYFLGVETFVPENEVTKIVYMSNDISGGYLRIPSIFTNAHSYAGAMVASIPWILGTILDRGFKNFSNIFGIFVLISGLFCALLGIFLAGPRSPIVLLGFMFLIFIMTGRVNLGFLTISILTGLGVAYFVGKDERMQRFAELQDLSRVQDRVSFSLNGTFLDVLIDYPMGNGMGAGGTSLPYFVQPLLSGVVILENEYARILLEQGLPGLLVFLAFATWFFLNSSTLDKNDKYTKSMVWAFAIGTFSTAWIGIGMMTSVPTTVVLLLGVGYYCGYGVPKRSFLNRNFSVLRYDSESLKNIPAYQRGLVRS